MKSKLGNWSTGGKSVEQGGYAMPTAKQKRFMDAAAHNPKFAKKAGIPSSVAKEFSKSSKGMTFSKGGDMKESKAMMGKELAFMKKKGAPKSMVKHEMAEMKNMKKGGYAGGGMPMVQKDGKKVPAFAADGVGKMKHGGMAKRMMGGGMAYSAGGYTRAADGVAKKGKTKGMQVKMRKGGMC